MPLLTPKPAVRPSARAPATNESWGGVLEGSPAIPSLALRASHKLHLFGIASGIAAAALLQLALLHLWRALVSDHSGARLQRAAARAVKHLATRIHML